MASFEEKRVALGSHLSSLQKVLVAFSGGVDSTLLLKVAFDTLGENVLAVTADSPSVPRRELAEAGRIAGEIGARHLVVQTSEIDNNNYASNPINRCYFCKVELYTRLFEVADHEDIRYVANGTNTDDLGDYRPGLQAADEHKVVSPLRDAGLTKDDVRNLARKLGLPIWDKPASPCLSSRIPYGSSVTHEKLAMIEAAESILKALKSKELRVRHFGVKARIEVPASDFSLLRSHLHVVEERFKAIGFDEIELAEFRSGALNSQIRSLT